MSPTRTMGLAGAIAATWLGALASAAVPVTKQAADLRTALATQLPLKETGQITLTEVLASGERLTLKHVVRAPIGNDETAAKFRNAMSASYCRDPSPLTMFANDGGTIEHIYTFADRTVSFVLDSRNCKLVLQPLTRAELQQIVKDTKVPIRDTDGTTLTQILVGDAMELIYLIDMPDISPAQAKKIAATAALRGKVEAADIENRCANPGTRLVILRGGALVFRRSSGGTVFSEARVSKASCGFQ